MTLHWLKVCAEKRTARTAHTYTFGNERRLTASAPRVQQASNLLESARQWKTSRSSHVAQISNSFFWFFREESWGLPLHSAASTLCALVSQLPLQFSPTHTSAPDPTVTFDAFIEEHNEQYERFSQKYARRHGALQDAFGAD